MWVYPNTIKNCLKCLEFWKNTFWVKYRVLNKGVRVGTKMLGSGQAIIFIISTNLKSQEPLLLIITKRDNIREKICSKEILVECLSGTVCNNKATRNWVLGSGHVCITRKKYRNKEIWQKYRTMWHRMQKRYSLPTLGQLIPHKIMISNRHTELFDRKY